MDSILPVPFFELFPGGRFPRKGSAGDHDDETGAKGYGGKQRRADPPGHMPHAATKPVRVSTVVRAAIAKE